ncbi:RGS domain-containing serine/threonine-protein kinase A-like isoform X1 [Balamuthia mandrillaris]
MTQIKLHLEDLVRSFELAEDNTEEAGDIEIETAEEEVIAYKKTTTNKRHKKERDQKLLLNYVDEDENKALKKLLRRSRYIQRGKRAVSNASAFLFSKAPSSSSSSSNELVNELLPEVCTYPLHYACQKGSSKCVQVLLEAGADPNKRDKNDWTPLHCACYSGDVQTLKALLIFDMMSSGNNNVEDGDEFIGDFSTSSGSSSSSLPSLRLSNDDRGAVKRSRGTTISLWSSSSNVPVVRKSSPRGKWLDYNARTKDGNSALHYFMAKFTLAKCTSYIFLFDLLVMAGSNINAQNNWGETPLHRAVIRVHGDVLGTELLLKNGANPNMVTENGSSPLHLVILSSGEKQDITMTCSLITLLTMHGIDTTLKDRQGRTASTMAKQLGLNRVFYMLRKEEKVADWLKERGLLALLRTVKQFNIPLRQLVTVDKGSLEAALEIQDPALQAELLRSHSLSLHQLPHQSSSLFPSQEEEKKVAFVPASSPSSSPSLSRSRSVLLSSSGKNSTSSLTLTRSESQPSSLGSDEIRKRGQKGWEIEPSEVEFQRKIGDGMSGEVYQGTWRGLVVAIKKLKNYIREDELRTFVSEIDMMSELRHPNVIQFLGASCSIKQNIFFITELAEKGNLHDCIQREKPSWLTRLKFARDIARGMNYLHHNKPPILHRDLKSINILIDEFNRAKVADFGISKPLQGSRTVRPARDNGTTYNCTLKWTPPDNKPTTKSDVYSFGIVMWEIITGLIPFQGFALRDIIVRVHSNGERPPVPSAEEAQRMINNGEQDDEGLKSNYKSYVGLMQECWNGEESRRPQFDVILAQLEEMVRRSQQQ